MLSQGCLGRNSHAAPPGCGVAATEGWPEITAAALTEFVAKAPQSVVNDLLLLQLCGSLAKEGVGEIALPNC